MTSGKDELDDDFSPVHDSSTPILNFKIRSKRVLKCLRRLDPNKSANGVGPRILKECAAVLAPHIDKLFKFIVRKSCYPGNLKIGRVTPVHKRGSVDDPTNYRPVTVLDNLEGVFEDVIKPQFEAWISEFIPDWQYGFVSNYGTDDYGAALSFTLNDCIERRAEGILIATDIKGAFDRCWWERMKNRLRKKGMRGRALKLMESYLLRRFIQVVIAGMKSSVKQIYSGVPQGAKWSSFLWDFDISEMGEVISGDAVPFGYADDVSLWYEVNPNSDVNCVIQTINEDLAALKAWGDNNHTTFEKSKM